MFADIPGDQYLVGQIDWASLESSINGIIVYDGSFSGGGEVEFGILKHPIKLTIMKGKIVDINAEEEAGKLSNRLKKFDDLRMYYNLAHVYHGFNPGAVLSGICTEDERVWGSTEWGIGYQSPMLKGSLGNAESHAAGICMNSTVILDDDLLVKEGQIVHPELRDITRAIGK